MVCPAEIPKTTPEFETVATDGLLLVQVPPDIGDSDVLIPMQISSTPVI